MFFSWEDSVFYSCHQVCSLSDCQRSFFLKHFHSINDRTLALNCGSVKILSKLNETYSKEVRLETSHKIVIKYLAQDLANLFWNLYFDIDVECESKWALLIIKSREEWESADGATWWYPDQSESGALQLVIRYFAILQTSPDSHNQTIKPRHGLQNPKLYQRALQLVRGCS